MTIKKVKYRLLQIWFGGFLLVTFGIDVFFLSSAYAAGQEQADGLTLPRFVSLRSDRVNVRTGPGERYPVAWVYQRAGLPVEIIAEFDVWRKIRDFEGIEGWVRSGLLSSRRTFVILNGPYYLYETESLNSALVAVVEAGVLGQLLKCPRQSDRCQVGIFLPEDPGKLTSRNRSLQGWLPRSALWGLYQNENIE